MMDIEVMMDKELVVEEIKQDVQGWSKRQGWQSKQGRLSR